ncbi:MAG: Smr/MutS family protein [Aestuariivirgaceae bacterium]
MTKKSLPPSSLPDSALWDEVKQAVVPLKRGNAKVPRSDVAAAKPHVASRTHGPASVHGRRASAEPPALTGLDRRTSQKLTRGLIAYEAKLDLHGTGVEQARGQLQRFLLEARTRGNRLVLVVTGKGASPYARHTLHGDSHYHVPERQGRLRRLVSDWFHEPEFRQHVSGFQPAHPRHGGGGAFYVRLRRRTDGQ